MNYLPTDIQNIIHKYIHHIKMGDLIDEYIYKCYKTCSYCNNYKFCHKWKSCDMKNSGCINVLCNKCYMDELKYLKQYGIRDVLCDECDECEFNISSDDEYYI